MKTMRKGKIWRLAYGCCEHGSVVGSADDFGLGCDLGLCLCLVSVSFLFFVCVVVI